LISESEVGVSVAVTRQNEGAFLKTASAPGPPIIGPPPAGGVNRPASTRDAEVIFPSFNERDVRFSQVPATTWEENKIRLSADIEITPIILVNISASFLVKSQEKNNPVLITLFV
jgi:hypothetical protein